MWRWAQLWIGWIATIACCAVTLWASVRTFYAWHVYRLRKSADARQERQKDVNEADAAATLSGKLFTWFQQLDTQQVCAALDDLSTRVEVNFRTKDGNPRITPLIAAISNPSNTEPQILEFLKAIREHDKARGCIDWSYDDSNSVMPSVYAAQRAFKEVEVYLYSCGAPMVVQSIPYTFNQLDGLVISVCVLPIMYLWWRGLPILAAVSASTCFLALWLCMRFKKTISVMSPGMRCRVASCDAAAVRFELAGIPLCPIHVQQALCGGVMRLNHSDVRYCPGPPGLAMWMPKGSTMWSMLQPWDVVSIVLDVAVFLFVPSLSMTHIGFAITVFVCAILMGYALWRIRGVGYNVVSDQGNFIAKSLIVVLVMCLQSFDTPGRSIMWFHQLSGLDMLRIAIMIVCRVAAAWGLLTLAVNRHGVEPSISAILAATGNKPLMLSLSATVLAAALAGHFTSTCVFGIGTAASHSVCAAKYAPVFGIPLDWVLLVLGLLFCTLILVYPVDTQPWLHTWISAAFVLVAIVAPFATACVTGQMPVIHAARLAWLLPYAVEFFNSTPNTVKKAQTRVASELKVMQHAAQLVLMIVEFDLVWRVL